MANAVTWNGQTPADLRREIVRMPMVLEAQLRGGARTVAEGIRGDAAAAARARGWSLANAITMVEDPSAKAWVVSVASPHPRPANLPLWLEYGTRKMPARPFFGPGVIRGRGRYPAVMERAMQSAFDATVNK